MDVPDDFLCENVIEDSIGGEDGINFRELCTHAGLTYL